MTDDDKAAGLARKEGFLKALHDNDISIGKHDMQTAEFKMESGHEKAEVLLRNKTEYDFIFCATDSIAAGAEICCIEHGLKIPEDIMIAGLGDSQLCRAAAAPLSSVHFRFHRRRLRSYGMLDTSPWRHSNRRYGNTCNSAYPQSPRKIYSFHVCSNGSRIYTHMVLRNK